MSKRTANPILAYTTAIDASKTVGELTALLARKNALHVGTEYQDGRPIALTFTILVCGQPVAFRLQPQIEGVGNVMRSTDRRQHERVAWRILLRWTEAQLAMNEAGQAPMAKLFLPYAVRQEDGETFWEHFESMQASRQLGDGSKR